MPEDREAVFAVHGDARTNLFNPSGEATLAESIKMLGAWLELWKTYPFAYWAVATKENPEQVIGFGGLLPKEIEGEVQPNLYFRFIPDAWG